MVSDDAIAAARHAGASDLFVAFVRRADDHELARDLQAEYEGNPSEVGRVATDAFGRAVWDGAADEARRRADDGERAVLEAVAGDGPDADRYGATRDGEATDESPRDDPENHDAA
ncbi:hypothetical protein [Halomarina litorea]|uniref:hypothetical protein n=1 Tax=Halomarina litorea TaxID=2961595 RepID=UPI0020C5A7C9|nr:hypothetical protein [Halomarina sp. BCD28]